MSLRMLVFGNALGPDEEQPRIEGLAKEALVVQGAQDARREGHVRVGAVGPGAGVQAGPPSFSCHAGTIRTAMALSLSILSKTSATL